MKPAFPWALSALPALTLALTLLLPACQRGPQPEPRTGGTTTSGASGEPESSDSTGLAGTSRLPTPAERSIIQGLMRDASRVRQLPFLQEVPAAIQDEARIRAFVAADVDADELQESKELYVALGLLPRDVDLEALLMEVLGEQIVGYYDPEAQRLVVRDDVMRSLASGAAVNEARVVLVHELVHALQDQHLHLGTLNEAERDSDADNAYRALVEGDATLAMMAYVLNGQGVHLEQITSDPATLRRVFETGAATNNGAGALERAPAILRVTLMAPYVQGALFCGTQHRVGGWDAVNRAHGSLPVGTEQVLHPEKFQTGELPDTVAIPTLPSLESLGFVRSNEDTLGELEMSIFFAQGTPSDQDLPAAAGWSGDRLAIYSRADAPSAAVWWSAWDTEADAIEAAAAATRSGINVEGARVERRGRALLILRHVPTPAAADVVSAFEGFARALPPAPPRRAVATNP